MITRQSLFLEFGQEADQSKLEFFKQWRHK